MSPQFSSGFCGSSLQGISPASVEEVQAILKVANQYQIPLWTCSQGKNFG